MNRIVKIGENNVEVTPSKVMTGTDEVDVTVWDESKIESYGQDRIDKEKASIQAEIVAWNSRSAGDYGLGMIDIEQAKLDNLNLIQETMNE